MKHSWWARHSSEKGQEVQPHLSLNLGGELRWGSPGSGLPDKSSVLAQLMVRTKVQIGLFHQGCPDILFFSGSLSDS